MTPMIQPFGKIRFALVFALALVATRFAFGDIVVPFVEGMYLGFTDGV